MDLKTFIFSHWRWLALLAALVVVGVFLSWEGSALTALLWFSSKQAAKIKRGRKEVLQEAEALSDAADEEEVRQKVADVELEVVVTNVREATTDNWDDVDIQTAPRLKD